MADGYVTNTIRPAPQPMPETKLNPSAFGSIEDAARMARQTAERVDRFVTRLCGSTPETVSTAGQSAALRDGLLAAAEDHAAVIRDAMTRINADLDRLERNLP